jgi:hypothetical protein
MENNFDFTSGEHFWQVRSEGRGIRFCVVGHYLKAPDSEPLRVWKRALPGEIGSGETEESGEDEGSG